jgi:hypothetical protein
MRYRGKVSTSAATGVIAGTPVYTPFVRLNTLVNGAVIDSINQYGQVAHMIVQTSCGVSKKYGAASTYGYSNAVDGSLLYLDGKLFPASQTLLAYPVSGPLLGTMLSQCEKNLPLFCMGGIRLQFTTDTLANMSFNNGTITDITNFQIDNFEVTYQMVDMGAAVEKMVYDMGPQLFIKTHGWNNSSVSVAAGTSGSQTYVFNQRLASIRSAYICPNRPTGSKQFEFVDLTNLNGTYQLNIGSQMFPQMPLDTLNNFAGIFTETSRAAGLIYGANSEMSISVAEAAIDENDATASLLYYTPGKFIAGVALSKVGPEDRDVLMCGSSTYNQPIGLNLTLNTATSNTNSLNLMLDYDAVFVLDVAARQLSVRS